MPRIAVVVVHNKSDAANTQQCADIIAVAVPVALDPNAFTVTGVANSFFTAYQIVPNGVTRPSNMNQVPSYRTLLYRATATSGRMWNWSVRRGIDDGADAVAYLSTTAQFTATTINAAMAKMPPRHFLENEPFGQVVSIRWLLSILPLLDDSQTYANLITAYKARAAADGLVNG